MEERRIIDFMFKVFVGNNVIANHQMNKEISKVPARGLLKEKVGAKIAEGAEGIKAFDIKDSWWSKRVDIKGVIANAKKYEKDYERTLPETLAPQTENEMWKRAKNLKDKFQMGMLSREELHPVRGFLDNGTMKWVVDDRKMQEIHAPERELKWQKNNGPNIEEYKNIMRHLCPDDPFAGDIERFRPHGGIK